MDAGPPCRECEAVCWEDECMLYTGTQRPVLQAVDAPRGDSYPLIVGPTMVATAHGPPPSPYTLSPTGFQGFGV